VFSLMQCTVFVIKFYSNFVEAWLILKILFVFAISSFYMAGCLIIYWKLKLLVYKNEKIKTHKKTKKWKNIIKKYETVGGGMQGLRGRSIRSHSRA
jgi:hypothetical protein